MTNAQKQAIDNLTRRLGARRSDWTARDAPDLPPSWISVSVGDSKGRPKTIDIDPEGKIH